MFTMIMPLMSWFLDLKAPVAVAGTQQVAQHHCSCHDAWIAGLWRQKAQKCKTQAKKNNMGHEQPLAYKRVIRHTQPVQSFEYHFVLHDIRQPYPELNGTYRLR
jgi:hypothetical protein